MWNSTSKGAVFSPAVFSQLLSRASTSQPVAGSGGQSPEAREKDLSVFATCRHNPRVSAAYILFAFLLSVISAQSFLLLLLLPSNIWVSISLSFSPSFSLLVLTCYCAISSNHIREEIRLCYTPSLLCCLIMWLFFSTLLASYLAEKWWWLNYPSDMPES